MLYAYVWERIIRKPGIKSVKVSGNNENCLTFENYAGDKYGKME